MSDSLVMVLLFVLYVLYVVLPLVPAIILFRMFPNTRVGLRGPFHGLRINATGAFGAYLVTVLLGYAIVRSIQTNLDEERQHVYQGVIVGLDENVALNSDRFYAKVVTTGADSVRLKSYSFMIVESQAKSEKWQVTVQLWELPPNCNGLGAPPPPRTVNFFMQPSVIHPSRYRVVKTKDGEFQIKPESEA